VEDICRQDRAPAAASDCVDALKKLRLERERAEAQREIARLQEQGAPGDDARINALGLTIKGLSQRIEALMERAPSKVSG
jgi:hypothetical protein